MGTCLFVAVPVWQLIGPGPFDWHMRKPAFWQGGIEALVLCGLMATGMALNRSVWLLGLVAMPAALYLRRHGVDVPLLIDLLYLEIVIGLGMAVRRLLGLPAAQASEHYLQAFLLGFVAWSVAAWSLSALDLGSIKQLRWLTLLLALPAFFGRTAPLSLFLFRRTREQRAAVRIWCGLLAAWLLILFARSNVVVGYDPLWYGLRAEYVLDPGHSLFEPLGLVSPVYYFPKLYEAFLLPVSAMHDFSVIDGMTILLLLPILMTCRALMQRLGTPDSAQWPLLAAIATLPALANSVIGPKPDVIALLFVLMAALAAIDVVRQRSIQALGWAIGCCGLSCLAKLTAIPYAGVLALSALAPVVLRRASTDPTAKAASDYAPRAVLALLVGTAVLAIFVTARTWLLAGVPTIGPDPLMHVWNALGWSLKEPAGTLSWTRPVDIASWPGVVFDVLLRPYHEMPHMIITWVGNIWLWLGIVALSTALGLYMRRPFRAELAPLLALSVTGLLLFFGVAYLVRGSDGNYFLFAVVPATIIGADAAFSRLRPHRHLFMLALACLPAFVLFHAAYALISAGWAPGTMAFDTKLDRGWHDTRHLRRLSLEREGLAQIDAYLKERRRARVTGYTNRSVGHWLRARYESLDQVGYARPEYMASTDGFRRFLVDQRIGYLILPRPTGPGEPKSTETVPETVLQAAEQLAALPGVHRIDDRRHYLLDFSAVDRSLIASPMPNDPR